MKKIIIIILLLISVNSYAQDLFGHAEPTYGMVLLYSGKFYQSGVEDEAPAHYTGQDGATGNNRTGTTEYNPYGLTYTVSYDSIGCYTVILSGIPERFDYTTSNLFAYSISSYTSLYTTSTTAVKSSATVRVSICNFTNYYDLSDGDNFAIFIYLIK